ncbi:ATPase, T2SS/T4P/T4SS family [Vibrio sp. CDRSL-10 TSBA]
MSTQLLSQLRQAGVLDGEQETALQRRTQNRHISAPQAILEQGVLTPAELGQQLSRLFSLPLIELDDFDYPDLCQQLGLSELIIRYQALPLQRDSRELTLAVSDPGWPQAEEEFCFATGLMVKPVLTDQPSLQAAIRRLYGETLPSYHADHREEISQEQLADSVQIAEDEANYQLDVSQDEAPVSRFIHQVLLDAVRKRASDIHFEPYESSYRIRIRCDGILIQTQQPAPHLSRRLAARLKILARLDIAQRRLPQDGRIKLRLSNDSAIDLRVSTLPTLWGEKIVLRLLDNQALPLELDQLGYSEQQKLCYLSALHKPQGMILITGPTGSGKTISLYCGLQQLNREQLNIATAEDPVEINLNGINQVQVQPAIGFGFAQALRTFLRQDPDVLMVGEIRDRETADVALKAAQTGHLVLSTLHTNSAAETLIRLLNMGIEPFNLASSLNLIVAQRLVRRLCPQCKIATRLTREQAASLHMENLHIKSLHIESPHAASSQDQSTQEQQATEQRELITEAVIFAANPDGCPHCNRGYAGRTGIYEMLSVDPVIADALLQRAPLMQLESLACQQGMQTLQQAGCEKLLAGQTSLAELQRVLGLATW